MCGATAEIHEAGLLAAGAVKDGGTGGSHRRWRGEMGGLCPHRRVSKKIGEGELAAEQATALRTAENYAAEMDRANQWAASLNQEVEERRARVTELQEELDSEQESSRRTAEGYLATGPRCHNHDERITVRDVGFQAAFVERLVHELLR